MPRISDPESVSQLNKALQKIDKLEKKLLVNQDQLLQVQKQVTSLDAQHAPSPSTNNIVLTWTGGSGTISWPQANLQDKNAGSNPVTPGLQHTIPIVAGSKAGLTASTHYWVGWSKTQQKLIFSTDAHPLLNQQDMTVVCRIFTGTAGQSGVAGGGGSQSTRDLSGLTYKNF